MESVTADRILRSVISGINAAKENILRQIVEQIEGRPAELLDAKNFILARYSSFKSPDMQMVIYKNVHVGNIDVNMIERTVTFTPN